MLKRVHLHLNIEKIEVDDNQKELAIKNINVKAIINGFDENGELKLNHFELNSAEVYGKVRDFEINGTLNLSNYEINYAAIACKGDGDWNYTEYNASKVEFNATEDIFTISLDNGYSNDFKFTNYFEFDSKYKLEDENGNTYNYELNTKHLENGEVKITSSDGLSTTLPIGSDGNIVGEVPVYYNGKKVGIIVENNDAGFIKYEDGTFESFK